MKNKKTERGNSVEELPADWRKWGGGGKSVKLKIK
jgi:hypothetical protein